MCFPQAIWGFTCSACCVCDTYLSYDASNLLQKHKKTMFGVFVPRGGLLKLSIFFGQIIGNKTKKLQNRKLNSLPRTFFVCFRTLPCISSLMVRVTFSPPSDWTLMGSMSGLDVKEGAWSRERGVQGPTRVWWWSQPTGHLPDKRDKDTPAEIRPSTLCFSTLFWKFNVDIQLPGDTKAGFKPRNSNANTKNILFKFTLSLLKFFVVLE